MLFRKLVFVLRHIAFVLLLASSFAACAGSVDDTLDTESTSSGAYDASQLIWAWTGAGTADDEATSASLQAYLSCNPFQGKFVYYPQADAIVVANSGDAGKVWEHIHAATWAEANVPSLTGNRRANEPLEAGIMVIRRGRGVVPTIGSSSLSGAGHSVSGSIDGAIALMKSTLGLTFIGR